MAVQSQTFTMLISRDRADDHVVSECLETGICSEGKTAADVLLKQVSFKMPQQDEEPACAELELPLMIRLEVIYGRDNAVPGAVQTTGR